jgi:hypothetical protein
VNLFKERFDHLKCRFYKREKGEVRKNLCMAELAILGVAGEARTLSDVEVIDTCLSDESFKDCNRFQWVEREKDKEILKSTF